MHDLPWQYEDLSLIVSTFFNYTFKDDSILIHSMRHSSFTHEAKLPTKECNERLEFLGDSVLSLFVSEKLTHELRDVDEGVLSQIRSSLVNEKRLAQFSKFASIDQFFLLGKGEEKNGGRERSKNLCRLFEALLGALFVDSNYEQIKKSLGFFINKYESEEKINLFSKASLENFDDKSKLQALFLKDHKVLPRYKFIKVNAHQFKVELFLNDKKVAFAFGRSKKEAEQDVARKVLNKPEILKGE